MNDDRNGAREALECKHFGKLSELDSDFDGDDGYFICGHLEGTGLRELLENYKKKIIELGGKP